MKLNKKFIKLLAEEKRLAVLDLLGKKGLGLIVPGEKTLKSLEELDEIFYTIDFLEREKIILVKELGNIQAPHVGDCLCGNVEDSVRSARHLIYTNEKLSEYYKKEIKTNYTIYDFINNGYRTDLQKERSRNFWLPIWVAIGTTVGVSFLTALFERLFSCH